MCYCDGTYKLLDLIAISRLLNEVEGTAHHSCCYLACVIPSAHRRGDKLPTIYALFSLGLLSFLSNLVFVLPGSREEKGSPNLFLHKREGGSSLFCL